MKNLRNLCDLPCENNRHTHAQAMCQALQALNMTGTTEYFKFRAILQE